MGLNLLFKHPIHFDYKHICAVHCLTHFRMCHGIKALRTGPKTCPAVTCFVVIYIELSLK